MSDSAPPELSSAFLLETLDGRDIDHDPDNAAAELEAAAQVRKITRMVLDSRQKLASLPIESLDQLVSHRSAGAWLLDDFYCHELLARIPKMVRRTLELSSLTIDEDTLPQGPVHVFYEQAIRCYVHGLWQATAVLARGTVETALRERVGAQPRDALAALIEMAVRRRFLVAHAIEAANVVKVIGDHAVHGQVVKESEAKKLVTCAREVLIQLFRGRLGEESRPR